MSSYAFSACDSVISRAAMSCRLDSTCGLSRGLAGGADRVDGAHAAAASAIGRLRKQPGVRAKIRHTAPPFGWIGNPFGRAGCCGMFGGRTEMALIQR